MTEYARFVGVDISNERLDVHVHPSGDRLCLANTAAGAAFTCEASGSHERALLCAAVEASAPA